MNQTFCRFLTCIALVGAALLMAQALVLVPNTSINAQRAIFVEEVIASDDKDKKDAADPLDAWIKAISARDPLDDAQLKRARELLPLLGDPKWEVREGAMLELLLLPTGVAAPLVHYQRKHSANQALSKEAQMRLDWLLENLRQQAPIRAYLARVIGVERAELEQMIASVQGVSEVLERLPRTGLSSDRRLWAFLMLYAATPEQTTTITGLLAANAPTLPLSAIYQAMLAENPSYKPDRRAAVLQRIASEGDNEELLRGLMLSASDRLRLILEARDKLREALVARLGPAGLLKRFDEAESDDERLVLLSLATFEGSPQARQGWLERGEGDMSEAVRQAYFGMVARTSLIEAVSAHLSRVGPGRQVYQMLSAQDDLSLWHAMLKAREGMQLGHHAELLTWLPTSKLPRSEVIDALIEASANPELEAVAASMLSSMVSRRVADHARSMASKPSANADVWRDLLARSGQLLLRYGVDVRAEPWLAELNDRQRAWLESSLGSMADPKVLYDLCYSPDTTAMEVAVVALANMKDDPVGALLATNLAIDFGLPPTLSYIDQAMLGSASLRSALNRATQQQQAGGNDEAQLAQGMAQLLRVAVMAGVASVADARHATLLNAYPSVKFLTEAFSGPQMDENSRNLLLTSWPWYAIEEADVLERRGEGRLVVDALVSMSRRQAIPDVSDNPRLPSIQRGLALAFARQHEEMGLHVAMLARGRNELVLTTALDTLFLHGSPKPFAQNLPMLIPQQNLRLKILLTAALSPELPMDWIAYQETTYGASLAELASEVFPLLIASSQGNMVEVNRYARAANPEVAFAAKRVLASHGNVAALQSVVDSAHLEGWVAAGGWDEFANAQPLYLNVLIEGIQADASLHDQRWYWRATRNLHVWDAAKKRYVLGAGE